MSFKRTLGLFLCLAAEFRAQGQAPAAPVSLRDAVELSLKSYPSLRISQEQIKAAAAAIQLARTAYLPKVDVLAQVNRATRNNVFGLLLPQGVIPGISGPVIGSNNSGSVWGSALGALVTWEPFDFGLRAAGVAAANAARAQEEATARTTRLEVAAAAADAYLTVVAAQQTVRAAQAGVDRAQILVTVVGARVNAELRPGADRSRAEAELAAARTQLIRAEESVEIGRATLAQFTGADPSKISLQASGLDQLPPAQAPQNFDAALNPRVQEQAAAVQETQAQLRVLERTYFPRFYLQGSTYARGSGAELNGSRLGGTNGLAPTVQNFALGLTVSFPVLDLPALRAREAAQSATLRAQTAKGEQVAVDLRAQWNRAVATLSGARRVAENTPVQASAAKAALQQATARYEAGLATIAEVADAQRLLTDAEIDDSLARLRVWQSLLGIAVAAGDIQPFIAEASR